MQHATNHNIRPSGFGQLSLVEHALCPLHRGSSLVENMQHTAEFRYTDASRQRQTARARVFAPLGLSANDELYLWGLLALTLTQRDERAELVATPHWCLRQLGVVDSQSGRGGEQYRLFRDAIRRLSAVSYLCDAFYDPIRAEHREVSFHLLSFNLPTDPASSRAWRLCWDLTFLEFAKHTAGHLRFDLELYRSLDPATRRLLLLVSKIFHRRADLPQLDLRALAVDVLGFSANVAARDLRVKVSRCLRALEAKQIVADAGIARIAKNQYVVNARRGQHYERLMKTDTPPQESTPVIETLLDLGFDLGAAIGLSRRYPTRLLEEWVDITQAARERFGHEFFKKSPMAFFVDSVSKAHKGRRTPPDWWHEVRKQELSQAELPAKSKNVFEQIRNELFRDTAVDGAIQDTSGLISTACVLKAIR